MDGEQQMALEAAIVAATGMPMANRWYVVAEVIDSNGEPYLMGIPSPGMLNWVASGMLRWEADSLAAQPVWQQQAR